MIENMYETVREIKRNLPLSMNGSLSAQMRNSGLNYKINYGTEIPRLIEIAKLYGKNHELSSLLWKENIRECRLLAIFIQPNESFTSQLADEWILSIDNPEIAIHFAKNLLSNLEDAIPTSFRLIASNDKMFVYCGYLTFSHLFRKGIILNQQNVDEFIDQACSEFDCRKLEQETLTLQQQTLCTALYALVQSNKYAAEKLLSQISLWKKGDNKLLAQVYTNLYEEYELSMQ